MNSMPNFTHKRKSVSRLMAPVALAVILAGCSTSNLYNQQAPLTDITAAAAPSATPRRRRAPTRTSGQQAVYAASSGGSE